MYTSRCLALVTILSLVLIFVNSGTDALARPGQGSRRSMARRGLPRWASGIKQVVEDRGFDPYSIVDATDPSLEYYVQVDVSGVDVGTLLPALDSNTTNDFGEIDAFTLNVTSGYDVSSQQLGIIRGYTVQTSYTSTSVSVEVEVLDYNDGAGVNGTISLQGLITEATNELAILGGSGSFRGVTGYDIVTFINASSSTIFVYHHALYFL